MIGQNFNAISVLRRRLLPRSVRSLEDQARHDEGVLAITAVVQLIESCQPFVQVNSSEEAITVTVKTENIKALRSALANFGESQ